MKNTSLLLGLALIGAAWAQDRPRTNMYGGPTDGIIWELGVEAAVTKAESKKPVLLMHLLGKLDEEFC
jgi:hypothetical protein